MTTAMERTLIALTAATLALTGCSSRRLTDAQYHELCYAWAKGQNLPGGGRRFAFDYAIKEMRLSRQDAADALDVARREYCP